MKQIHARFELKWADAWVGAFWDRRGQELHIWICFVPCIPLHIIIPREVGNVSIP